MEVLLDLNHKEIFSSGSLTDGGLPDLNYNEIFRSCYVTVKWLLDLITIRSLVHFLIEGAVT
jgi:hypothetical protein